MGKKGLKEKMDEKETHGTKERIRDAAINLFSQKGYNAVSIREIARSVGINESTIYSHYQSKEEIMDTIIQFLKDLFQSQPDYIPLDKFIDKEDPEELVRKTIRIMLEQMKMPYIRKILRLMCIEVYQNDKFLDFFKNQYLEPSYEIWSIIFKKMIKRGYIIEYDTDQLAREFFNYGVFLIFELYLLNYNEASYESQVDKVIESVFEHITFLFDMLKKNQKKEAE